MNYKARAPPLIAFWLYSVSKDFLQAVVKHVEMSVPPPPWNQFGWGHPWYANYRQGTPEVVVPIWISFFESLDADMQERYLDSVNAPEIWRMWAHREEVKQGP